MDNELISLTFFQKFSASLVNLVPLKSLIFQKGDNLFLGLNMT